LIFVPSVFSLLHRVRTENDPSTTTEEEGQTIHA
jgi:hypothetical protein